MPLLVRTAGFVSIRGVRLFVHSYPWWYDCTLGSSQQKEPLLKYEVCVTGDWSPPAAHRAAEELFDTLVFGARVLSGFSECL